MKAELTMLYHEMVGDEPDWICVDLVFLEYDPGAKEIPPEALYFDEVYLATLVSIEDSKSKVQVTRVVDVSDIGIAPFNHSDAIRWAIRCSNSFGQGIRT